MGGWISLPGYEAAGTGNWEEKGMATSYRMPVRLEVQGQIAETRGVPGARAALRTELALSAVEVRVSIRTPGLTAGTTPEDDIRRVSLFPLGTRVTRYERRVLPIADGQRMLRVTDDLDRPLAADCEFGPGGVARKIDITFTTPVEVYAWVSPGVGGKPGSPRLAVRGELTFARGVTLSLSTRSASSPSPVRLPLLGPGTTLHARERRLDSGCPAEAWVFAGFVDEWGHELSDRCLLGRYLLP